MKMRFAVGVFALAALAMSGVAGEALKSGLPVGKSVSAFHPENITGPYAGQKQCLV